MTEEEIKKELEEIQSHPMFMTEIPENIENNIAVQSLQALKYEGKPEDVAIELLDKSKEFLEKYKSTKNFLSLKESMYNICNSIEHVKEDSTVPDSVKFDLFFFRSEIQLMVKNYGYAVEDLKWALFYQKNDEAYMRLIECYIQLESYEKALKTIRNRKKTILETEPTSHSLKLYDLEEAKVKSLEKQLLKNLENLATFKNKENADKLKLYDLLMRKGIKVNTGNVNMYNIPQNAQANIYLDDDKILHFPVFIIYEEFNTTDYIQDVEENSTISDILQILLGEENSLPFDKEKKYNLNTSICYYENSHYDMILKKEIYTYYPLRNDEKLIDILTSSKVTMNGFPIISIVSQISKFFLHFVKTKEITKRTRFI
jgi:hypothetical protein